MVTPLVGPELTGVSFKGLTLTVLLVGEGHEIEVPVVVFTDAWHELVGVIDEFVVQTYGANTVKGDWGLL